MAGMRILLRILTVKKLSDFNFLGGLASGLFDEFSIGRSRRSVNLSTFFLRSLKGEQCDFLGKNGSGELWVSETF